MSLLLMKKPDGTVERYELSKTQPLTIGSHTISDVQLEDDSIGLIEARISWAKKYFEITAAGANDLLVNDVSLRSAALAIGDRIRIGETDLMISSEEILESDESDPFGFEEAASTPQSQGTDEIVFAPISEEIPVWEQQARNPLARKIQPEEELPKTTRSKRPQSSSTRPREQSPSTTPKPQKVESELSQHVEDEILGEVELPRVASTQPARKEKEADHTEHSSLARFRESLHSSRQRPGEKEIFRSPLVLGSLIGIVFLLIGSVILWSLIDLEEADRYLSRAREQAEQRKFQQSIADYQQYLLLFPGDSDHDLAARELSITRVRSQIDIGVPDWAGGLEELKSLIALHRDDQGFQSMHEDISDFAAQIAVSVCQEASEKRDTQLFGISEEATRLVELYTTNEELLETRQRDVSAARREAEATILKLDVFDDALEQMNAQLASGDPTSVMQARRDLISRYEDARNDFRVSKLLDQALELDRQSTEVSQINQPALPPDGLQWGRVLSLSSSTRNSNDELASGRAVISLAADCVYGVDSATGEPIWRRNVGTPLPFFPLEVSLGDIGVLLYSTQRRELEFLSRDTGELIWRQSCPARPTGKPEVIGTQAYLTTENGRLLQIDLSNGQLVAQLTISQPFSSQPVLLPERKHLLAVGERDVLYLISLNPFEVTEVIYLGHGAGSVKAAPLRMGPYLLLAENDRTATCRLRLFDTRLENQVLSELNQQRLPGNVLDRPVIRGKDLFVPTTPERVTAFTVSAEEGVAPLTEIGSHQVVSPQAIPVWVSTGPDGQVWMASSALRRLRLSTDSLDASTDITAIGLATQPLQMMGDQIYVARQPISSSVTRFSRYHRDDFRGVWRTNLGDQVLHHSLNSVGEVITLNDSGDVFRLRPSILARSGFFLDSNYRIDFDESLSGSRLTSRFSDGRFGVAWGGPNPRLMTIRTTGQMDRSYALASPPKTPPIDLDAGIALGLEGRVHLRASNHSKTEDYLLPIVDGTQAEIASMTRIDGNHVMVLDSERQLRRLEYRAEPIPHLALVGELEVEFASALEPALLSSNRLMICDVERNLRLLDSSSLQTLVSQKLPTPAVNGPWIVEDHLFLELRGGLLQCYRDDAGATLEWEYQLEQMHVSGSPLLWQDVWLIPVGESGLLAISSKTGKRKGLVAVPGTCSGNLFIVEGQVVAPLRDGSLYFIPSEAIRREES